MQLRQFGSDLMLELPPACKFTFEIARRMAGVQLLVLLGCNRAQRILGRLVAPYGKCQNVSRNLTVMMKSEESPMPNIHSAFLAMPYRSELRWIRESIRQATRELSLSLRAVDEMLAPGDEIVASIRQEIRACSFAYVVLSDLNPNVMYELGLLHEASKPTVLLADSATLANLPFDIKTRMVITFENREDAASELTQAVIAATGRLLALFDPIARQQAVAIQRTATPAAVHGVQLSVAHYDWEKIKNDGARAVARKGCATNNISAHDDGDFKGWRLKARCNGGDTIYIYVDLNGDIASVDVQ